jgi:site-specific DNA-methyltransferase (adenine-specific)
MEFSDQVLHGDCLKIMPWLPDKCVDMILCDLPYAQTACAWDQAIIDPETLWVQWKRLLRPGGTVILTASGKFALIMGASNLPWFQYDLVWKKAQATNPMHMKYRPGKVHENILVFCERTPYYAPQMGTGAAYKGFSSTTGTTIGEAYGSGKSRHRDNPTGERYPLSVVEFARERQGPKHPTKKPLALFEYLIRTFSQPGAVILDNCAGIGTTGKAAQNTGRRYILIEKDEQYVRTARAWLSPVGLGTDLVI